MSDEWIRCDVRLPDQIDRNGGTVSETVKVLLTTGEESEDWLINGKWVMHCKGDRIGGYPVAWKYKEDEDNGNGE